MIFRLSLIIFTIFFSSYTVLADLLRVPGDTEVQPYLEKLKEENDIVPAPKWRVPDKTEVTETSKKDEKLTTPHLDMLKLRAINEDQENQKNSQDKSNGEQFDPQTKTASEKIQPHLEALKSGMKLEPKYDRKVSRAAGFSVAAMTKYKFSTSSDASGAAFSSVYRTNDAYQPGVDLFYEHQLLRSDYFGTLGPVGHLGLLYSKGKGIFIKSGGTAEDVTFRFYSVPISLGVAYRFTLARLVVPFVHLMGNATPMFEMRSDTNTTKRTYTRGYHSVLGVAFNIEWLSRDDVWQNYAAHGLIHTYLVAQYEILKSFSGGASNIDYQSWYGGLSFEF